MFFFSCSTNFSFRLLCCAAAVALVSISTTKTFFFVIVLVLFSVKRLLFLFFLALLTRGAYIHTLVVILSHNKRHLKRLWKKNSVMCTNERVSERRRKRIVEWEFHTHTQNGGAQYLNTQTCKSPTFTLALAPFHLARRSLFPCLTLLSLLCACLL